ncbi:MBL fold metallo-hydrolase [Candidatus Peregrinibacteria bacterium]|nr:MBL fold metallo-hydrolase [Candidatus Peregrinibacteria bacterium]
MQIRYFGHSCFIIEDGKVSIVTDPFNESIGLKLPSLKATIVTVSHTDPESGNSKAIEGEPRIFDWPGEYETLGVHIKGIHSFHSPKEAKEQKENTIFAIEFNGIRLCHLGDQGCRLTPEQLEKIGEVDVLFIPVGGNTTIDAKKAQGVIEQLEPRVVIPMQYNIPGIKMPLDPLGPFLGLMGAKEVQPIEEFKFKKSELPEENTKIVVLDISR